MRRIMQTQPPGTPGRAELIRPGRRRPGRSSRAWPATPMPCWSCSPGRTARCQTGSQTPASPATPWPGWGPLVAHRAVLPGSRAGMGGGRRRAGRCRAAGATAVWLVLRWGRHRTWLVGPLPGLAGQSRVARTSGGPFDRGRRIGNIGALVADPPRAVRPGRVVLLAGGILGGRLQLTGHARGSTPSVC